jgi:hypothetical protein
MLALGYGGTINTTYFKQAKNNGYTWMNSKIYLKNHYNYGL